MVIQNANLLIAFIFSNVFDSFMHGLILKTVPHLFLQEVIHTKMIELYLTLTIVLLSLNIDPVIHAMEAPGTPGTTGTIVNCATGTSGTTVAGATGTTGTTGTTITLILTNVGKSGTTGTTGTTAAIYPHL